MNPVGRVTLPAPQFGSGKPYRIQVLQPAFLTGRERILERMHSVVHRDDTPAAANVPRDPGVPGGFPIPHDHGIANRKQRRNILVEFGRGVLQDKGEESSGRAGSKSAIAGIVSAPSGFASSSTVTRPLARTACSCM